MAAIRLNQSPDAPSEARAFILSTLFLWGRRTAIPIVELVADELVTNAVRYASGTIELDLGLDGDALRISVSDEEPTRQPLMRTPTAGIEGGYGLQIVDTVSESWGCDVGGTRKTVWAELDLRVAGHS